ncbi:MAG: HAD-IB family phosphatase [Saprospiraceae bacterium]|nr:HAD-IB family phosphatase [Saprospiraceae bacterium]
MTADNQPPTANNQPPTADNRQPTADYRQPTTDSQLPIADSQQAFFDFDGTLTNRDSMRLFFRMADPRGLGWWRFLWALPGLVWRHGIGREPLKKALVEAFLGGKSAAELTTLGERFVREVLPRHLNTQVLAAMRRLRDDGARVVIVSAALDVWLAPFARQEQVGCLCTEVACPDGVFRGAWRTPNCRGPEKRARMLVDGFPVAPAERARLWVIAYGNSRGDREMLAMADEAWWVSRSGTARRISGARPFSPETTR